MNQARSTSRLFALSLMASAALLLGGCGSTVKLDDKAGNGTAPITDATRPGGSGYGANNNSVPSTNVAPVVVSPSDNAGADIGLARVIYFDFDSNVVKEEFRSTIEGHAKRLTAAKGKKVLIEGHTDERGGREYNLALGQRRAEAVQKSLTLLGVSPDQVEAVSFGEERPAVQGSGEEAWSKNRRAEIKDR
ncbi:MAG: peptidoglycan-associated lipoprotein Pal [Aquabacterium sp.]|nr:peptidoglycan-associated lipoprotein Pal [Aquabacterium sp.]